MTKTKFTPEQKIQTVLESIKTNISTAELYGIIDNLKKLLEHVLITNEAFYYMLAQVKKLLESRRNTKLYYDNELRASGLGN